MWQLPFLTDPSATIDDRTLADFLQRPHAWIVDAIQRHKLRNGTHLERTEGRVSINLRGAVALMVLAGHTLCAREVLHLVSIEAARACLEDWSVCAAFRSAGINPDVVRTHDKATRDVMRFAKGAQDAARSLDTTLPRCCTDSSLQDACEILMETVQYMEAWNTRGRAI